MKSKFEKSVEMLKNVGFKIGADVAEVVEIDGVSNVEEIEGVVEEGEKKRGGMNCAKYIYCCWFGGRRKMESKDEDEEDEDNKERGKSDKFGNGATVAPMLPKPD